MLNAIFATTIAAITFTQPSLDQAQAARKLKMRIAVAPLDGGRWWDEWQIPVEFRNAIDEKLAQKLLESGRFILLERKELDALLQEKAIKEENTGQSQKGKVVPAQALIQGKLTDFTLARRGTGGGINLGGIGRIGASVSEAKVAINVRIFNVDTSEILASEEAAGKAQSSSFKFDGNRRVAFADFQGFEKSPLGEATTKAIDQAVLKVIEKLSAQPWSARVADFDAPTKEVSFNAGSDQGVQVGDTFEIHRVSRTIKDPETGEVLSVRTTRIGRVRVKEVEKKVAFADLVEGTEAIAGDIVREVR